MRFFGVGRFHFLKCGCGKKEFIGFNSFYDKELGGCYGIGQEAADVEECF